MKFEDTFSAETIIVEMLEGREPGGGTGGIGDGGTQQHPVRRI